MHRGFSQAAWLGIIAMTLMAGCTSQGIKADGKTPARYEVKRLSAPLNIDGDWNKPAWQAAETIHLTYHMGERPTHFPKVQAKLLYDDEAVYVIFHVEDRYVRAVAHKHQDLVCKDSCTEFFFAPGDDLDKGYFNIEMNCGGIMLYHFQLIPRQDQVKIPAEEIARFQIAHSLPQRIDPEIATPTVWTVEYRLPIDRLEKWCPTAKRPAPGVTWRANFFKCADDCSHPHWLTWSYVNRPKPDFHVPECFGTLEFK